MMMGAVLQQFVKSLGLISRICARAVSGTASRRLDAVIAQTTAFLCVIGLTLAMLSGTAAAKSSARVEIRNHDGYGRIILSFDVLPSFRHVLDAGILILSFDESVEVDVENIPVDLPGYVGLARRDPDGRALRLALNRSFRVNLMEAGDQLYVDLLPPEYKGPTPPLPPGVIRELSRMAAEKTRKAEEEARQREATKFPYKLKVRLARNPTFSRIVFDWNKFVTVNFTRQGSKVSLVFGAQADADLSTLKVDPPKYLTGVKLNKVGHSMEMILSVDEDVDVRGFREGLTYVVDLTGPDASANVSADKTAELLGIVRKTADQSVPETAKDVVTLPVDTEVEKGPVAQKGAVQDAADKPQQTAATDPMGPPRASAVEKPTLPAEPEKSARKDDAPPMPMPDRRPERDPPLVPPVETAAEPKAEEPVTAGVDFEQQEAMIPTPVAQPKAEMAAPAASAEKAPAPKPVAAAQTKPDPPVAEQTEKAAKMPAPAPPPDGAAVVQVADVGPNLRLTFPFAKPISAAVFRRSRTIWLIFDTMQPLDLRALKEKQGDKLTGVQHVRSGSMQYLRLSLSRGWLTYVSGNDASWTVDIGDLVGGQAEPLKLQRKLREDKRSVIGIKLEKPGRIHWLSDPEIGDRLAVVTAFAPQRSVPKPQDFVEFAAIATAHGVAIQINSDDIAVRLKLDEVIITRRNGLTVSAGGVHQYVSGRKPLDRKGRIGFIDAKHWEIKEADSLSAKIHESQRAVALADDEERNDRRFDLAQLYFSNHFTREALGVLKRMVNIDPALENDPSFNVFRGAVLTLLGRNAEARKDFDVHALANDADAALWFGLLDAAEMNWESALQNFTQGADAIDSYRADLQTRFRVAAARSALELKKYAQAAEELDAVPQPVSSKALKAKSQLLRGWYLEGIGRVDEAVEAYSAVLKGDQRPEIAEAELRMISLLLAQKKMTRAEALDGLERLQLVWRGDRIELGVMRILADLYVKEKRYRDAFTLMRNGIRAYPDSSMALLIQDDMKAAFRDLYLGGGKDKSAPIKSLALYYDFRELMPVGRTGDEMIRRLADDLIEFDLLDQAAELLDHQVTNRLKGAARSQVATRLAMVHLMNHKPDSALRAIRQTRQAGLAGELRRSRCLLEARALADMGRAEAAIEILNTLKGPDVERLKSDALWTAQKWQKAGQQIESMLGGRWQEAAPLSDAERFNVLRLSIAFALAQDQFALDRVRKKYYEKMLKTSDADAFVLITKPIKSQGVSFREVARDIAASDTLDAFMKEFQARYDRKPEPAKTSASPNEQGAG